MMAGFLGRRGRREETAHRLYEAVATASRQPALYREFEVPDTVAGRFEMLCLHAFFVLRRLKDLPPEGPRLGQALHDAMFLHLDWMLRELGIGDLSVGKKVKMLARNLYGRIAAYEEGLAGGDDRLEAALRRNVYEGAAPRPAAVVALAGYVRRNAAALSMLAREPVLEGRIRFVPATELAPGGPADAAAEA